MFDASNLPWIIVLCSVVAAAVTVREAVKGQGRQMDENHKAATADRASLRADFQHGIDAVSRKVEAVAGELRDVRDAVAEGSTDIGVLTERVAALRLDHDALRVDVNRRSLRRAGDSGDSDR